MWTADQWQAWAKLRTGCFCCGCHDLNHWICRTYTGAGVCFHLAWSFLCQKEHHITGSSSCWTNNLLLCGLCAEGGADSKSFCISFSGKHWDADQHTVFVGTYGHFGGISDPCHCLQDHCGHCGSSSIWIQHEECFSGKLILSLCQSGYWCLLYYAYSLSVSLSNS
jgi:hypothetical protein